MKFFARFFATRPDFAKPLQAEGRAVVFVGTAGAHGQLLSVPHGSEAALHQHAAACGLVLTPSPGAS